MSCRSLHIHTEKHSHQEILPQVLEKVPCECESLMHGSVAAVGWEITPPTAPVAIATDTSQTILLGDRLDKSDVVLRLLSHS